MTARQKIKPIYKEGEIVVVRHQDNPGLPVNEYIGYVRRDVNIDSYAIPLINIRRNLGGYDSRSMFRTLDLRLDGLTHVTRLKRSGKIKRPGVGELYEVKCNDPDISPSIPEGDGGLSYRMVGCYVGISPVGGHNYHMFSNVCETDSEKFKQKSKDTTFGRRVFNRVRQNGNLRITKLIPTQS